MTDLQTRTARPSRRPPADRRPSVILAAATAALWAALVSLIAVALVALVVWTTDTRSGSSAGATLQAAAQVWLVAHGASLQLPQGSFALLPLGLTALPAWLLVRAGGSLSRALGFADLRAAVPALASLAAAYGVIAVVVAGLAGTDDIQVAMPRACAGAVILALLAGGYGALREAGLLNSCWELLPVRLRPVVTGGAVAAGAVYAAGALLVAASLALSANRSGELVHALGPGAVGGVALVLLSVAYAPTAGVWGLSVVAGPGFSIGAGTGVGIFGVALGPVPAFPLLAALPEAPVGYLWPLLFVPVVAGLLAGVVVGRAAAPDDELNSALLRAAGCGPAAAVITAVLSLLAAGSTGAGRLAALGPSAWQVGIAVALEVALPAAAGAWWTIRRSESQP